MITNLGSPYIGKIEKRPKPNVGLQKQISVNIKAIR